MPSKIEQEHFVRIVAERLRVPEDAIRAEVAKRPALTFEGLDLEEVPDILAQIQAPSQLERAAGLILCHFPKTHHIQERLLVLLGEARVQGLQEKIVPDTERFLFEFESLLSAQAGEGDEAAVADVLLEAVERTVLEEQIASVRERLRLPAQADGGPTPDDLVQKLSLLKRREQELRK